MRLASWKNSLVFCICSLALLLGDSVRAEEFRRQPVAEYHDKGEKECLLDSVLSLGNALGWAMADLLKKNVPPQK